MRAVATGGVVAGYAGYVTSLPFVSCHRGSATYPGRVRVVPSRFRNVPRSGPRRRVRAPFLSCHRGSATYPGRVRPRRRCSGACRLRSGLPFVSCHRGSATYPGRVRARPPQRSTSPSRIASHFTSGTGEST
jgi:hypothetical protein